MRQKQPKHEHNFYCELNDNAFWVQANVRLSQAFNAFLSFNALRFSHQMCPLFHSGGVTELAG